MKSLGNFTIFFSFFKSLSFINKPFSSKICIFPFKFFSPSISGINSTELSSYIGFIFTLFKYVSGTDSIQTVCHIPLNGVYHIFPLYLYCFPKLSPFSSKLSITFTIISFGLSNLIFFDISNEKGVYPPS